MPATRPLLLLFATGCAGVYYEADGCLIGRDRQGVETLFVPVSGAPSQEQVEAAIQAERRCISPDATRLPDDRFRHVIFMDLGQFIRCDDPRCR